MSLDTEIPGSAASVESVALWLRERVAPAVSSGADALVFAESGARSDWHGPAGSAFRSRVRHGTGATRDLDTRIAAAAGSLDDYAGALRHAQHRMADIRWAAAAAGLTVSGFVIEHPGPCPGHPGPPLTGPSVRRSDQQRYDVAVAAWDHQQALAAAWHVAVRDAEQTRRDYAAACRAFEQAYRGLSPASMVLTSSDIAGAVAASRLTHLHISALRGTAEHFAGQAAATRARMLTSDYTRLGRAQLESDTRTVEESTARAQEAKSRLDAALSEGSRAGALSRGLSRTLVGVAIVSDLHNHESPLQAVASNVGGYAVGSVGAAVAAGGIEVGATIAASAGIGAVAGSAVPVVGTAVGAIVGAGVGIAASGAIDSLFRNGPDAHEALDAGGSALADTVSAGWNETGDVLHDVGGFVGGLFD